MDTISKYYVPVAVNLNNLRKAKTAAGDLYRSIERQTSQYQGLWVVSPEGRVLAYHEHYKSEESWPGEVYAMLQKGLDASGTVRPRLVRWTEPLPNRGLGVRPDGSVSLAIYIRRLSSGRLKGAGTLDSLTLSASELEAFAPPATREGTRWLLPAAVARQLCRCLSPESDQASMPLPADVTQLRLAGEVHWERGDILTLVYTGQIAAVHKHPYEKGKTNHGEARIEGTGRYNARSGQLLSLTFVLDGVYYNFQPYHREPHPILAGIEWQCGQ
jgi:hypothetical protein